MNNQLSELESKEIEESLRHSRELYLKYRRRAVLGGAIIGAILGAIIAGPYFREWQNPLASYLLAVLATAGLGALTGYLFREIIIGREVSGPLADDAHNSSNDRAPSPGADWDGDD